jgi:hypothetical protein
MKTHTSPTLFLEFERQSSSVFVLIAFRPGAVAHRWLVSASPLSLHPLILWGYELNRDSN